MCSTSKEISGVIDGKVGQVWLADKSAMAKAGILAGGSIPEGAEGLLVQRVVSSDGKSKPGLLLLFSERPRSLSDRERDWVAAIAKKVGSFV